MDIHDNSKKDAPLDMSKHDCMSCRLVGAGTLFAATGVVLYHHSRLAPERVAGKRFFLVFASGLAGLGLARLLV